MSDDNDDLETGWKIIDTADFPGLETEEGRDAWAELLVQQDDESLKKNETSWIKCIVIHNGTDMVARFVYDDGSEEIMDLVIRRQIAVVSSTGAERN